MLYTRTIRKINEDLGYMSIRNIKKIISLLDSYLLAFNKLKEIFIISNCGLDILYENACCFLRGISFYKILMENFSEH